MTAAAPGSIIVNRGGRGGSTGGRGIAIAIHPVGSEAGDVHAHFQRVAARGQHETGVDHRVVHTRGTV
jgi:hypothetical protein